MRERERLCVWPLDLWLSCHLPANKRDLNMTPYGSVCSHCLLFVTTLPSDFFVCVSLRECRVCLSGCDMHMYQHIVFGSAVSLIVLICVCVTERERVCVRECVFLGLLQQWNS